MTDEGRMEERSRTATKKTKSAAERFLSDRAEKSPVASSDVQMQMRPALSLSVSDTFAAQCPISLLPPTDADVGDVADLRRAGEIPPPLPGVIIPLTHSDSGAVHGAGGRGRHLRFAVIAQTRKEVRERERSETRWKSPLLVAAAAARPAARPSSS